MGSALLEPVAAPVGQCEGLWDRFDGAIGLALRFVKRGDRDEDER